MIIDNQGRYIPDYPDHGSQLEQKRNPYNPYGRYVPTTVAPKEWESQKFQTPDIQKEFNPKYIECVIQNRCECHECTQARYKMSKPF